MAPSGYAPGAIAEDGGKVLVGWASHAHKGGLAPQGCHKVRGAGQGQGAAGTPLGLTLL